MKSHPHNQHQTANSKQQTANSKQQTANSKQQTANSKQQTANSKDGPEPIKIKSVPKISKLDKRSLKTQYASTALMAMVKAEAGAIYWRIHMKRGLRDEDDWRDGDY